jgi:hypothetical protein
VCISADALNINARLVPHALTQDHKEVQASICAHLLQEAQNNSMFSNNITADDVSVSMKQKP